MVDILSTGVVYKKHGTTHTGVNHIEQTIQGKIIHVIGVIRVSTTFIEPVFRLKD